MMRFHQSELPTTSAGLGGGVVGALAGDVGAKGDVGDAGAL